MKRLFLVPPLVLVCLVSLSEACAPVMREGGRVAIASESALIVYDEKTKTEHFIRRGTFDTRVPYFGFLVPTPTKPEIEAVPDDVFTILGDWTKPKVVTQTVKRPRSWAMPGSKAEALAKDDALPGGVAVLGEGTVAGLDYKILQGSTAAALKAWLDEHNYVTRPDLEEWLKGYVEKDWVITAFQMAKPEDGQGNPGLQSKAVRMSFRTDEPFYPYLEPEAQREPGTFRPDRLLRVYCVSVGRTEGRLRGKEWEGKTAWSKPLDDGQRQQLADKLKNEKGVSMALPEEAWLTEFEDRSSPRPGGSDLFFATSADQSQTERPAIVQTVYVDEEPMSVLVPMAMVGALTVVVLGSLAFLLWRTVARKPA